MNVRFTRGWYVCALLIMSATLSRPGTSQQPRAALSIGTVAVLGPPQVADSTVTSPVQLDCDLPIDVGYLRGGGRISYFLGSDGRLDLSSLQVSDSSNLSAPALQSAAFRILSRCRARPARNGAVPVATIVSQVLRFHREDSVPTRHQTPYETPSAHASLPLQATALRPSDPRLEELPVLVVCDIRWVLRNVGSYDLRYVIGVDGRPEPGSVERVLVPKGTSVNTATEVARTCRYTPGRVRGQPARVWVQHRIRVEG